MTMLRLQIDDRDVSAPEGATVLDVTKSAGIDIPRLCHMAGTGLGAPIRLLLSEQRASGAIREE
ncbi:MAG: 2Fe-2S iron-sulfur cluster-binding protein [Chloroflexota bacterium]